MTKQDPKQPRFDGSWAAWKDRLGIAGVLIDLALLFFFIFIDSSLNFQCSVKDFIMMKCNRFDRDFIPWDQLEKKPAKSSSGPSIEFRGGKVVAIRLKVYT